MIPLTTDHARRTIEPAQCPRSCAEKNPPDAEEEDSHWPFGGRPPSSVPGAEFGGQPSRPARSWWGQPRMGARAGFRRECRGKASNGPQGECTASLEAFLWGYQSNHCAQLHAVDPTPFPRNIWEPRLRLVSRIRARKQCISLRGASGHLILCTPGFGFNLRIQGAGGVCSCQTCDSEKKSAKNDLQQGLLEY